MNMNYVKANGILAVLLILILALVVGCSSSKTAPVDQKPAGSSAAPVTAEWAKIVEAAKKEGKVVIMGPPGGLWRDALTTSFKAAYPGINVEFQGMSGRDLGPKVIAEQKAGQYLADITVGGPNTVISQLIPAGTIVPLPRDLPETLPDVNESKWHSGFKFGFMDKEGQYNYAFQGEIVPVYVNKKLIPEGEIKDIKDLLKPQYKGKIVWNDPRVAGAGNFLAQTFVHKQGEAFLRQLLAQDIVVTTDLRQQADWLVRGTYPIAIGTSTEIITEFKNQGIADHIYVLSDPKSGLNGYSQGFGTVSLFKNAPNLNAAKVYINWLLSAEAQKIISNLTTVNSRRLDVPVANKNTYVPPGSDMPLMGKEEYDSFRGVAIKIATELLK